MNNNALIKLTEERISDNNALQTFVERAKALTNPIFPETVQFTDSAMKYGAAIVTVDVNTDNYGNNRDIYKNESGGYCLHLSKINEIAQQTGIQIIDSRILERKVDEGGKVVFISHQVKGRLKSVDGSIKEDVATGKYDYYRDLEKYISKKNGQPLTNMINSRRSHAEALAESNAKTRLFNKMVAKLPTSFTIDELKKPFLIPYVLEDKEELLKQLPEAEQIQIRKELARKRLGLIDTMYSPPAAQQISPQASNSTPESNSNMVDADYTEETNEPSIEEKNKIIASEFKDVSQKERTEKIMNLIRLTGWEHPKGVKVTVSMIENASLDVQIGRLEELLNLQSAKELEEVGL